MRPDLTPHQHNRLEVAPFAPHEAFGHAQPAATSVAPAVPADVSVQAAEVAPAPVPGGPAEAGAVTTQAGRRAAPRLRLSLPAKLIAVEKAHTCILLNLSRTGAQVAILDAMREGEGAILRCGMIDHFAIITRSEFGLNALEFDEPLSDEIVLETRRYHENFEERERRALIETARKWATGDSDDRAA